MQDGSDEQRSVIDELLRRGLTYADAVAWRAVVTRGPCAALGVTHQVEAVMNWRAFFCLEYVQAWYDSSLDAQDAFEWACVGYSPSQALAVQWCLLEAALVAAAAGDDVQALLEREDEWRRSWLRPDQVIRALRSGLTSPAAAERKVIDQERRWSA